MSADIFIKEREELTMTGVSEVLSFESDFITVMSAHGKVEIEGCDMRIVNMSSDTGNLIISGRIDGVYYAAKPKVKKGFFSREAK